MTISDKGKVDLIAVRPGSDEVLLMITDHLQWDDVDDHMLLVQDKVNDYLEFVESGQLRRVETPTIPDNPVVRIVLKTKHFPPDAANAVFDRLRSALRSRDIGFEVDSRTAT